MSSSTVQPPPLPQPPPSPVAWRSWPLRDLAPGSWLAVVAIGIVGGIATQAAGHWAWGLAAAGLLTVSLWRFFLPVFYRLDAAGVTQWVLGRPRLIPWSRIISRQVRPGGLVLSTRPSPTPLDALYLPWGPKRDEVVESASFYLGGLVVLESPGEESVELAEGPVTESD